MSALAVPAPSGFRLPSLAAIDAEGRRREPLMWGFAILLLVAMVPLGAAYLLDARTVNDVDVWGKPLKFAFSVALYFGTLAWLWGWLPARRGRLLDWFGVVAVVLVALEIVYIVPQSARGVASHFNTATVVETVAFAAMGTAAIVFTSLPVVLGIAIARAPRGDVAPALRLSVILGLIVAGVLGIATGLALSVNGGHWVAAAHTDAGGFPVFGWTREGGDLRVAHFFALHAMQILPVAGWLVASRRPNATGLVWGLAAAFTAFAVYTLVEALMGRPFLAFLG